MSGVSAEVGRASGPIVLKDRDSFLQVKMDSYPIQGRIGFSRYTGTKRISPLKILIYS